VNLAITPQLRLILLLSLLFSAMLMGGLFFVMRAQLADQQAIPAPVTQRPAHQAAPNASSHAAATKPKTAAKAKANAAKTAPSTTKPAAKKAATQPGKTSTPSKPSSTATLTANGLPPALAKALKEHRVVVAVLAVPGSELDSTVLLEAAAGSADAGVGFVKLDVLRERTGRALAAKLGVVETPTVVVYRRPSTVFVRLQGLVDRVTIAQAAVSALGR
jgi:hypothetical protein